MTAEEKNLRIDYWYKEGMKFFFKGIKTKDKHVLGAFNCCTACIAEYDKKQKDKRTQKLQKIAWHLGYLMGETSLERLENSGHYSEKYLAKLAAALNK